MLFKFCIFIYLNIVHSMVCEPVTKLDRASFWLSVRLSTVSENAYNISCDYIKKYSRPIGFLFFYRPIHIILSADWSDYIEDITRRLPKTLQSADRRPTVGRHIGR